MEIRVNKDINTYRESVFFGMTLRQLICAAGAIVVAVVIYFCLPVGKEAKSWCCIFGALPIAIAGFFKYNNLTVERFIVTWFKTEVLYAGKRPFCAENYYYELLNTKPKKKGMKQRVFDKIGQKFISE